MLPWILIVVTVLMVVGPVMMIRPSRSQQKQAALRSLAAQEGMIVRLPGSEFGKSRGALYALPLARKGEKRNTSWCVQKLSYAHDIHFSGVWDWQGKGRPESYLHASVKEIIEQMPSSMTAVGVNPVGIFCLWDERYAEGQEKQAIAEIERVLAEFASKLGFQVSKKASK